MALDFQNVCFDFQRCRICLVESDQVQSLYNKIEIVDDTVLISEILAECGKIKVSLDDNKPQKICHTCVETAKICYKFKVTCMQSEAALNNEILQLLNKKDPLEDLEKLNVSADVGLPKMICFNDEKPQLTSLETVVPEVITIKTGKPIAEVESRTCKECGQTFEHRNMMLKHRRTHYVRRKTCQFCDFIPETPTKLGKHMEINHCDKKNISCTVCGKKFFRRTNLRVHMVLHTGIKRHVCEICGISFAMSGNLAEHRRVHTGEKPYKCKECGKLFSQQAALRSHEAGHSNIRNYVCNICGASFTRSGGLRNHEKRHLNDRPFACSMCDRKFRFSSERKRHMNIHTGDKSYECEVCGKYFNRQANLRVHSKIHTGERPHICHVCGKGFIQAHCLRSHLNTHGGS